MSPLRSREVKALSEAVEHIYQETDLDQFPHRVFDVIGRMLPGVFIVSQEFNTRTRDARSLSNRAAPVGLIERCAEIIPVEHPIFHAILGGARGALRLSDFWTARQLRRTSVYHEIFKPIEVQHEIVIPLILPNHVAGLTISRDHFFSDEELALVHLLAPHIALAHVHAQRFTALRERERNPDLGPEALSALGLTPREAEVLHWIIQGKRNIEIATIIGCGPRTVHKHVENLLEKLGVETRTAAATEALRRCSGRAPAHQ